MSLVVLSPAEVVSVLEAKFVGRIIASCWVNTGAAVHIVAESFLKPALHTKETHRLLHRLSG